eukprot:Em0010g900a
MLQKLVTWFVLVGACTATLPQLYNVLPKFEYKYSFKGPYLVNSKGQIPFWTHGGNAIASEDQVRVCPSIRSRKGWVWANEIYTGGNWMVDVTLRVTGRLRNGADGLAIWFTETKGSEGPLFGNVDSFKGIGVIMDSFDNDGLNDNPKILVVLSNGSLNYDHQSDGLSQASGSCLRDFRNRPHPVKLRITYLRGALEVWVHEGLSDIEDDYEFCVSVPAATAIPSAGYFGVSAATGGLSDDHDVLQFITHSLILYENKVEEELKKQQDRENMEQMTKKYSEMSSEFEKKLEEAEKTEEGKGHDGEGKGHGREWEREVERDQNVRVIAETQMRITREIQALTAKLDQYITSSGHTTAQASGQNLEPLSSDVIQIKTLANTIQQQLSELRTIVDHLVRSGSSTTSQQQQPLHEVKTIAQQNANSLQTVEAMLKTIAHRQSSSANDSSGGSCLSPYYFTVVIVIQAAVIVGYHLYHHRQERAAKKFF